MSVMYDKEQITNGKDFWHLIDAMVDDNCGFLHNKDLIVEAYQDKRLYGLRGDPDYHAKDDPIFIKGSYYLLPCFCVAHGDIADMIWTHSRARRRGLAATLVDLMEIKKASHVLKESVPFWTACDIEILSIAPYC